MKSVAKTFDMPGIDYRYQTLYLISGKNIFQTKLYTEVNFDAEIDSDVMKNIGIDPKFMSLSQLEAEIWQKVSKMAAILKTVMAAILSISRPSNKWIRIPEHQDNPFQLVGLL